MEGILFYIRWSVCAVYCAMAIYPASCGHGKAKESQSIYLGAYQPFRFAYSSLFASVGSRRCRIISCADNLPKLPHY